MSIFSSAISALNTAQLATFGESVTYEHPPDDPITVQAIERQEPTTPTTWRRFWFRVADVPNAAAGDRVTVGSGIYIVAAVDPEQTEGGGVSLTLNKIGIIP